MGTKKKSENHHYEKKISKHLHLKESEDSDFEDTVVEAYPATRGLHKGGRHHARRSSKSGLKAAFSDDNKQYNYYLDFLQKYNTKVKHNFINISERIKIVVKDKNNLSLANAEVKAIFENGNSFLSKTYADGSCYIYPSLYNTNNTEQSNLKNEKINLIIKFKNKIISKQINRKGKRTQVIKFNLERKLPKEIPLDIVFVFDTTGSMGEEIERLKKTIEIIYLNLQSITPKPLLRFAMVLYKDRNDTYNTKVIPLTSNLQKFQAELNKVSAGGGGDTPEDLQEALSKTITNIKWNSNGIRLAFIITDAPPQLYTKQITYKKSALQAKQKAIKFFSIGTGGLNLQGEYILRQIAQLTSGKYIFLTYGEKGESSGGASGSVSHHTGSNFVADKLEKIILNFTRKELSFLSNISIKPNEEYFKAIKIDGEKREKTLENLFKKSLNQLIDYSSMHLEFKKTKPNLLLLPVIINNKLTNNNIKVNAEYFHEQLSLSIAKDNRFNLLARDKNMADLIQELKISMSGLIKKEDIINKGKFLGAKFFISIQMFERDKEYELFLRLIRVESAEVLSVSKAILAKELGL